MEQQTGIWGNTQRRKNNGLNDVYYNASMNSRTAKAAHPRLKVVQEQELELGTLSTQYKALKQQQAIDLANSFAIDTAPEWAQGETVLELKTVSGGVALATLEDTDPESPSEPCILRSEASEASEGVITLALAEGFLNGLTVAAFAAQAAVYCTPSTKLFEESDADAMGALAAGARVVLVMREPPELDEDAYKRAEDMTTALIAQGAKEVAVLEAQTSLQAVLSLVQGPELVLAKLLANARPIQQIRSSAKMATSLGYTPYVSTVLGQVVEPEAEQYNEDGERTTPKTWRFAGTIAGEKVYAKNVLMTAAPVVESVTTKIDVLDPKYEQQKTYGLAVQIGPKNKCKTYHIEVREEDLEYPKKWRAKLPAGSPEILLGQRGRGTAGGQAIGEAVRQTKTSEVVEKTCIQTVMWHVDRDNVPRWVDGEGAHGPHDKTPLLYQDARPQICIPSPDNLSREQIEASIDALFFNTAPQYVDPTVWMVGVCSVFNVLAGGHPHGVLWYVGEKEAGKSYVTGMLASIIGPEYGPKNVMGVPDSTLAALRSMIEEISNAPVIVDDYRPRASRGKQDAQEDATDQIIRAGYTGGSALAGRKEQAPDKKTWMARPARNTHPCVIIAGESLPSEENASAITRLFVVDAGPDTLKDGAIAFLDDVRERHGFQPAAAAFLRWRAATIQNTFASDLQAARIALEKRGVELAAPYLESMRGDLRRLKEVATSPLTGAATIRDFLVGTDQLTEDEGDKYYRYWAKLIVKAAKKHGEARLTKSGLADQVIRAIQDQIAAGHVALAPFGDERLPLIGQVVTTGGEGFGGKEGGRSCVALIPSEVRSIAAKIGIKNVQQVLAPYLIRGDDGRLSNPVRIKGHRTWGYFVDPERWDPYGEDGGDDADDDV
jgi:hypothetical protein